MARLTAAALAVWLIIFAVPIAVYGLFQAYAGAAMPEGASPFWFLAGVALSKAGTALAFTALYALARPALAGRWLAYATAWWIMFVLGELGQTLGPGTSWANAAAGIVSESLYVPLAAWVTQRLLAAP